MFSVFAKKRLRKILHMINSTPTLKLLMGKKIKIKIKDASCATCLYLLGLILLSFNLHLRIKDKLLEWHKKKKSFQKKQGINKTSVILSSHHLAFKILITFHQKIKHSLSRQCNLLPSQYTWGPGLCLVLLTPFIVLHKPVPHHKEGTMQSNASYYSWVNAFTKFCFEKVFVPVFFLLTLWSLISMTSDGGFGCRLICKKRKQQVVVREVCFWEADRLSNLIQRILSSDQTEY